MKIKTLYTFKPFNRTKRSNWYPLLVGINQQPEGVAWISHSYGYYNGSYFILTEGWMWMETQKSGF